jgi:hypothetical protein
MFFVKAGDTTREDESRVQSLCPTCFLLTLVSLDMFARAMEPHQHAAERHVQWGALPDELLQMIFHGVDLHCRLAVIAR